MFPLSFSYHPQRHRQLNEVNEFFRQFPINFARIKIRAEPRIDKTLHQMFVQEKRKLLAFKKLAGSLEEVLLLGHSSEDCKRAFLRLVSLCFFTWKSLYKAWFCCRRWCATQQEPGVSFCAKLNLCIWTWQRILYRKDSQNLICLHSAQRFLLGVSGPSAQEVSSRINCDCETVRFRFF